MWRASCEVKSIKLPLINKVLYPNWLVLGRLGNEFE